MGSLSEANTRFAYDLFQQFRKSEKENIFYSPLSITSALAMTSLGSKGHTALEIQKALHFNEVTENTAGVATTVHVEKSGKVPQQFQKLLTELNKPTDAYELHLANRLYGEWKFPFLPEYMEKVKKFYLASVESADFAHTAEESRKRINSWVESQMHEKIKNLFPPKSLDSTTVLLLVNTIYFKGQWDERFDPKRTEQTEFWLNKNMHKTHVHLYLPRFKMKESYDLRATMTDLGMVDAFSPWDADFSGMTGSGLILSQVLHMSFVEVTEEGTETAAANSMRMTVLSAPRYELFNCNHPFLFFIRHNKTNSILFLGRIFSP
ncbi:LOW QUALITY PROTEIN: serpin B3-like [Rhynchonycteris naso]